jgi:hypothetical protein
MKLLKKKKKKSVIFHTSQTPENVFYRKHFSKKKIDFPENIL